MNSDAYWDNYRGVSRPRYTQVPDEVLDELLPRLGHAELKVLLFIVRQTFGWGKEYDSISLSQLTQGTQLHRKSVMRAVKGLEEKRILWVQRDKSKQGDAEINAYGLVVKDVTAGGRGKKRLPQAHKAPNKKHSLQETKDENERPSSSSRASSSDKQPLISQLATEFAPNESIQAIQTYLGRFPIALITRAAEITRANSQVTNPIAYLYGVIQRLQEQAAMQPAAHQYVEEAPELTEEEYQSSLQALERVKEQLAATRQAYDRE